MGATTVENPSSRHSDFKIFRHTVVLDHQTQVAHFEHKFRIEIGKWTDNQNILQFVEIIYTLLQCTIILSAS